MPIKKGVLQIGYYGFRGQSEMSMNDCKNQSKGKDYERLLFYYSIKRNDSKLLWEETESTSENKFD